jgi:hypothetical protein
MNENDVSVYAENVYFSSPEHNYSYKVHEGMNIEIVGRKFLLDALKPVDFSRRDRIPKYRGMF